MPRKRTLTASAERKRRQNARRSQTTEQRNIDLQRLRQRMHNHRQQQNQQKKYCCARLGISVEPHSVGRMDQQCIDCTAKIYAGDVSAGSSSICCHKGKMESPLKSYLQLERKNTSHSYVTSSIEHKPNFTPTRYERERAAMKNKPRKILNLEERVLAIRLYHANPVYQRIASIFKCSWEQIRNVIANRDDILRYYGECQTVTPNDSRQFVRNKKINFLGNVTYEFIKRAYFHRITVLNDDVIRQKAIKLRDILQIEQFHPNRAWIADFKKVYNVDWNNLDSIIICGSPHRSLDCKDLIDYCTKMVSKAVALMGQIPKQIAKKEIKNDDTEQDEYDDATYDNSESDAMLVDNYDDVPVVNEVDDCAGIYITNHLAIEENEINNDDYGHEENEVRTNNSVPYNTFNLAKTNATPADHKTSVPESPTFKSTTTSQLITEVQIKQERRSRSKSPFSLSPQNVESCMSTNEDLKRKQVDKSAPNASELKQKNAKIEIVNSYTMALHALSPLEDFVTQQEDFRAINLLMQLASVFEKGAKQKHERTHI